MMLPEQNISQKGSHDQVRFILAIVATGIAMGCVHVLTGPGTFRVLMIPKVNSNLAGLGSLTVFASLVTSC